MSVALVGAALGACGGAKPRPQCKEPELLEITIHPSTVLNEGEDGATRSVNLRVYQLTRPDAFERAVYDELWQGDGKAALADTLVAGPEEALLVAGRPLTFRLVRHPDAQRLALAGKFRNVHGAWRAMTELPPHFDPCDSAVVKPKIAAAAVHSDLSFQPASRP